MVRKAPGENWWKTLLSTRLRVQTVKFRNTIVLLCFTALDPIGQKSQTESLQKTRNQPEFGCNRLQIICTIGFAQQGIFVYCVHVEFIACPKPYSRKKRVSLKAWTPCLAKCCNYPSRLQALMVPDLKYDMLRLKSTYTLVNVSVGSNGPAAY